MIQKKASVPKRSILKFALVAPLFKMNRETEKASKATKSKRGSPVSALKGTLNG